MCVCHVVVLTRGVQEKWSTFSGSTSCSRSRLSEFTLLRRKKEFKSRHVITFPCGFWYEIILFQCGENNFKVVGTTVCSVCVCVCVCVCECECEAHLLSVLEAEVLEGQEV